MVTTQALLRLSADRWSRLRVSFYRATLCYTLLLLFLPLQIFRFPTAAASDAGPVGYWPFDEGFGITATDYSSYGNSGTLLNGTSWSGATAGFSLKFDGSNDYVEIPHADHLNTPTGLTVSAWINNQLLVNRDIDEYRIIASKGWAASSGGSWTLAWHVKTGALFFFARNGSDTSYRYLTVPYLNSEATEWHLITAVFDRGNISLYQDGELRAGPLDVGSSLMNINTDPVRIGSLGKSDSWRRNWNGLIDDVYLYNRALTGDDIASIYEAGQQPVSAQPFSFSISNSGNLSATQGSSAVNTIATTLSSGAPEPVSFTVSGLPQATIASLSKTMCTPSCSTFLTVTTSSSTPIGTYPLIVTASGGNLLKSTTINLTVAATAVFAQPTGTTSQSFDFSLSTGSRATISQAASDYSVIGATLTAGAAQPISFSASGFPSGVTHSFSSSSCVPSCRTDIHMNVSASAPTGNYPIIITATGAGITRTTSFTLSLVASTSATTGITAEGGSNTSTESSTSSTVSPQPEILIREKSYFVSSNGSDSNPGTETQPFGTIRKGVKSLTPGTTLYIKEGTYAEELDDIPSGLSWEQPVTISAYPGHIVVLKPNAGGSTRVIRLKGPTKRYIIINGLILDAVNRNVGFETAGNDNATGPQHIRIKNVEIKNAINSGVFAVGSHHEFIGCSVHHNGTRHLDHGLYITPTDSLIDGCTIYNNAAYGLHIYSGNAKNLVIKNSTVYNHPKAGILVHSNSEDVKVYNNIVRHNAGPGIMVAKALRTKILNNTVYANNGAGIEVSTTDGRDTAIINNILFQNKGGSVSDNGVRTVQSHNSTGDPGFENASTGDFRLRVGSAAIDAGVALSEVSTDLQGTPRPQGARYDIGAFERAP
jgi:hypothetical protein